ncbi:cobalamin biosynthesis protein CbiM [Fibrobacteres bacterium R8-0-B4]
MHMSDALLSPAVGVSMYAVSTAACAYAVKKIKRDDLCEKKIPVMGVMGAFVFAAQMINFTIPVTGSSGHIGGGILLSAMIGGLPALLSISAVLVIQCLFFADGGLFALGCNIFNMGVVPCLIVYPLIFEPLVKKGMTAVKITLASVAAVVISLQIGAFCVVLETLLSGVTALPFSTFVLLMQPIHFAIGIVEGIVTSAILYFVYKARPEIMESTQGGTAIQSGVPMGKVLIVLAVVTALVGGALSLFASSYPDGLEWAVEKTAGTAELETASPTIEKAGQVQSAVAVMPDYDFKDAGEDGSKIGTTVAGIAGGTITFLLAWAAAFAISAVKKRRKAASTPLSSMMF